MWDQNLEVSYLIRELIKFFFFLKHSFMIVCLKSQRLLYIPQLWKEALFAQLLKCG